MPNQELINYIKQQLSQGISREQIKSSLLQAGWQEKDVEEALLSAGGNPPPPPSPSFPPPSAPVMGSTLKHLHPSGSVVVFL